MMTVNANSRYINVLCIIFATQVIKSQLFFISARHEFSQVSVRCYFCRTAHGVTCFLISDVQDLVWWRLVCVWEERVPRCEVLALPHRKLTLLFKWKPFIIEMFRLFVYFRFLSLNLSVRCVQVELSKAFQVII